MRHHAKKFLQLIFVVLNQLHDIVLSPDEIPDDGTVMKLIFRTSIYSILLFIFYKCKTLWKAYIINLRFKQTNKPTKISQRVGFNVDKTILHFKLFRRYSHREKLLLIFDIVSFISIEIVLKISPKLYWKYMYNVLPLARSHWKSCVVSKESITDHWTSYMQDIWFRVPLFPTQYPWNIISVSQSARHEENRSTKIYSMLCWFICICAPDAKCKLTL